MEFEKKVQFTVEAYDRKEMGKEINILELSRYSKELLPYKLELERVLVYWARPERNELRLLGSGTESEAWEISSNLVLKIYRDSEKYKDIIGIPINSYLLEIRPMIFASGSFNRKLQWVIMERFDIFDEYDLELDILIAELSYCVEKTIGSAKSLNIKLEGLAEKVISRFEINSDFPAEMLNITKKRYHLNNNWFYNFAKQITYLHLTDKSDDLWLPNLGISRVGYKDGSLIFFDW